MNLKEQQDKHKELLAAVLSGENADVKIRRACNKFINETVEEVATTNKLLHAAGVDPAQYDIENLWN